MMDEVIPGRKYVSGIITKPFKGGAKFQKDDTLFARITPCLENGKIAKYSGQNGPIAFGSTEFFVFRAKEGLSDSDYVYYLTLSDIIRKPAEASMFGASGRQRADLSVIENIDIDPPPLPIQKKIASILSAYDDLIENNVRRIKILEEMALRIYREWYVHFRYPGYENERLMKCKLGIMPEGWEIQKVGDVLLKVGRKKKIKKQDYKEQGIIPVVDQGRDFIGGYTNDFEAQHTHPLPIIIFGDHTRILKYVDFPFACGADGVQLIFTEENRLPLPLLYYMLKTIDLSDFAYARHFKFLKEKQVIIPKYETALTFSKLINPMRNEISCLRNQNSVLRQTRDLLLPKLISGTINVSKLDINMGFEE